LHVSTLAVLIGQVYECRFSGILHLDINFVYAVFLAIYILVFKTKGKDELMQLYFSPPNKFPLPAAVHVQERSLLSSPEVSSR